MDTKKNEYYVLNESAMVFFRYLVKVGSLESAKKLVAEYYGYEGEDLHADLDELLHELVHLGFLQQK
ncbi:PqqD family protein [Paenactinomyces guangxiensis]|uniref:PqqD family protein n=1 Tax=Paenactinomyces guangxiensis TaxID=1490290 RepID=A0A7W2A852_9BACL|nr:PqqD family protein [Paenactinomyces guangxiensis]MBA4493817.1 PqqD family protein [Paenactinomyces guangxiensis]MBH8591283.1 PqqD family protein [Paenactinomyces guangxiensis]